MLYKEQGPALGSSRIPYKVLTNVAHSYFVDFGSSLKLWGWKEIEKRQQDKPVKNNILPKCIEGWIGLFCCIGKKTESISLPTATTLRYFSAKRMGLGFSRCLEHISAIPQQNKSWRPNSSLARPIKINADNIALVHHKSRVLLQCTRQIQEIIKRYFDNIFLRFTMTQDINWRE